MFVNNETEWLRCFEWAILAATEWWTLAKILCLQQPELLLVKPVLDQKYLRHLRSLFHRQFKFLYFLVATTRKTMYTTPILFFTPPFVPIVQTS